MKQPKKYKVQQQVLSDFTATIDAKPNLTQAEIFQKFPEFNNDPDMLQVVMDYHTTTKSGKYATVDEINAKFPEFQFDEKKNGQLSGVAGPPKQETTLAPVFEESPNGLTPQQTGSQGPKNKTEQLQKFLENDFNDWNSQRLLSKVQPKYDEAIAQMFPKEIQEAKFQEFQKPYLSEFKKWESDRATELQNSVTEKTDVNKLNEQFEKERTERWGKVQDNSNRDFNKWYQGQVKSPEFEKQSQAKWEKLLAEAENDPEYQKELESKLTEMDDTFNKFAQMNEKRDQEEDFQKNKETNPAFTLGKKMWSTMRYQLPADLIGASIATQKAPFDLTKAIDKMLPESVSKFLAGGGARPSEDPKFGLRNKEYNARIKSQLLDAYKLRSQGEEANKYLVDSLDKAQDGLDYLNWAFAALGQAAGQIPAAIATRGATAYGQEIGTIYLDGVQKIADEKGLTPEQVIEQGLDDSLYPILFGMAAGRLESLGAKGVGDEVMKSLGKKEMMQSFRDRALGFFGATGKAGGTESLTEGAQTVLEQLGVGKATDKSWLETFSNIDANDIKESMAQGAVGGSGLTMSGRAAKATYSGVRDLIKRQNPIKPDVGSGIKGTGDQGKGVTEETKLPVQAVKAVQPENSPTVQGDVTGVGQPNAEVPAPVLTGQEKVNKALENLKTKIKPQENEGVKTDEVSRGSEQKDTRSIQEASEDVVSGISRASQEAEGKSEVQVDVREEENKSLEKLATEKGILVDGNQFGESHVKFGRESDVYLNEEKGTVTKINHLTLHGTWNDFFKRINLQNRLFPNEAITVVGYTKKNDRLVPILEQPLIRFDKDNPLTQEERNDELAKRGFKPVRENVFYNPELDITLKDATSDNVVRDENGNIRFIDPILSEGNPFESDNEKKSFYEEPKKLNGEVKPEGLQSGAENVIQKQVSVQGKQKKSIKELEAENKRTFPKVPISKVFSNGTAQPPREQRVKADKYIEDGTINELPEQDIDVKDIVPTQKNLTIGNLEKTKNVKDSKEQIIVLKHEGKYYVLDGHHRIANHILNGDKTIKAHIYDAIEKTEDPYESDVSKLTDKELSDLLDFFDKIIKEREQKVRESNTQILGNNMGVGTLTEQEFQRYDDLKNESQLRNPPKSAVEAKVEVLKKRADKIAKDKGFDNASHLLNSVKKRTGKEYATVQEVPNEVLDEVISQRKKEYRELKKKQDKAIAEKEVPAKVEKAGEPEIQTAQSKIDQAKAKVAKGIEGLASKTGVTKHLNPLDDSSIWDDVKLIIEGLTEIGGLKAQEIIARLKEELGKLGIKPEHIDEKQKEIEALLPKEEDPKPKRESKGKPKKLFTHLNFGKDEIIEVFGANYTPQSNAQTVALTKEFIEKMGGLDEAFAAREKVHPAVKVVLYAEKLDALRLEMDTNPLAMTQYMNIMDELQVQSKEGGQFIQMLDYVYQNYGVMFTAEAQIEKYKQANNGEISPEMWAKFQELGEKHKELEQRIKELESEKDALQSKLDVEDIKNVNTREGKIRKQRAEQNKREAREERAKLKSELLGMFNPSKSGGRLQASIIPVVTPVVYGIKIANTYIKEGVASLEIAIENTKEFWREVSGTDLTDEEVAKIKAAIEPNLRIRDVQVPYSMIKDLVKEGFDTIETLVPEVLNKLKKRYPTLTERQVRDIITGYGKIINPSKDEIDASIRKLKRIGRIKSQLEDLQAKKRPLKTGPQRDKIDAEERALMKEVRELMKDLPIDEETEMNQLRTAMDAKKSRLKNRIEDLDKALKEGKKIPQNTKSLTDEEIAELEATRDSLQEVYDSVFSQEDNRLARIQKNLEEAIFDAIGRIEHLEKREFTAKKDKASNAVIDELRDRLKNLRDVLSYLKEEAGITEMERLDQLSINAQKMIDKYTDRLKRGDFSKRVVKPTYRGVELDNSYARLSGLESRLKYATGEEKTQIEKEIADVKEYITKIKKLQELQIQRENVREEFAKEHYKNEQENRGKWVKAADTVLDIMTIPRQLNAGFEFSSVFIQGRTYTLYFLKQDIFRAIKQVFTGEKQDYHTLKNLAQMFKSWWSKESHERFMSQIKTQPFYIRAKESGLAIRDRDVKLEVREEVWSSRIITLFFDKLGMPLKWAGDMLNSETLKKAYKKWTDINISAKYERAAHAYLNAIRMQRYIQLEEKLRNEGKNFLTNPEDYKSIADAVNTLSGSASVGPFEGKPMKIAPIFFYSARMLASTLKQVSPLAFYQLGKLHSSSDPNTKASVAQKAYMADFISAVGMQVLLMQAFVTMMQALSDDDDDWEIEWDARSSKFLQIRKKGEKGHATYIDPWGGLRTAITLQIRLMTGEVTNRKGEVKNLGTRSTPSGWDLLVDFFANKAAPLPSLAHYGLDRREKYDRKTGKRTYTDKYGNKFEFEAEAMERFYPMYLNSILEMKDVQSPEFTAFGILIGLFGVGSNTYDEKEKK